MASYGQGALGVSSGLGYLSFPLRLSFLAHKVLRDIDHPAAYNTGIYAEGYKK